MRQVNLHRAAHCEQTAQAVLKKSRQNTVGQVGILPTSASWTNSPPPHLSILWDNHITGMITSTSWDDHISCARQHIVENYLFYDIPSARRWPRSADPIAWPSWARSRIPQGRDGRAFAWIRCAAKSTNCWKEATPRARGAKRRERSKAQELLDRLVSKGFG